MPLQAIETSFAVDSSGFSTCRFVQWVKAKYTDPQQMQKHDWIKVHLMCGTTTNIGFENHGKTPAVNFTTGAMVSVRNVPEPDLTNITAPEVIAENLKQLPYGNLTAEGGKTFLAAGAKMMTQIRGPELTASLIDDIKQLRRYLFVFGGAGYKDGLGRSHSVFLPVLQRGR